MRETPQSVQSARGAAAAGRGAHSSGTAGTATGCSEFTINASSEKTRAAKRHSGDGRQFSLNQR